MTGNLHIGGVGRRTGDRDGRIGERKSRTGERGLRTADGENLGAAANGRGRMVSGGRV